MPLKTGQVLVQRYRIVKLLGQGGFGAVYRAWDLNVKRPCAVKENLDTSPEAQRQFAREATILANLAHPNLPRVTDHFTVEGQGQYLVMDFVDGEDLASRMQREGTAPVGQSLEWVSQVADALTYLHSRRPAVVHRDIKPANIRITPDDKAMLVDFGLVKVYDPNLQTTMGARAVTPGYAPPEQYGQGKTDARSDIYALGATLYKLLTGQEPLESVQRMAGKKLPLAHQMNPNISPQISGAIECAMNLEPEGRFQNAKAFKKALSFTDSTFMVSPVPDVSLRPVAQPPARNYAVPPAPPVRPASKKQGGRRIWLWAAIIGVITICVCFVGGSSVLYFQDRELEKTVSESETREMSTARAEASATAQSLKRLQATSTAQSAVSHQATLDASQVLVYGPTSGSLYHDAEDGMIEADNASVDLRNFIVEALFYNPYSLDVGSWDYGFVLRHEMENVQFRFVVKSDQSWVLLNNTGDSDGTVIMEGYLPELDIDEYGSNHVRLEFQDSYGYFFLNDEFITELDLSARTNSGNIYICTGVFQDDEVTGAITDYQDFLIWSLATE